MVSSVATTIVVLVLMYYHASLYLRAKLNMVMSGEFKQVSPQLLLKLKENPDFVRVFIGSDWISELDYKQTIEYLCPQNILKIKLDMPFKTLKFDLTPVINFYGRMKELLGIVDCRKRIEPHINVILAERKADACELHTSWAELDFFLAGYWYYERIDKSAGDSLPLIEKFHEYNIPLVNASFGGKKIGYATDSGAVRYLMPNQVKLVAKALSLISAINLRSRCEILIECAIAQGKYYPEYWECKNDFDGFVECLYNPLEQYFKDAADKDYAMLFYLI
ncbi:MAG: YfbM family protein [Cyanomargarita calcarea GSE-NOS-MK-12-04C]|uniref:YfbM family protein n=1 Tax=Cyanomargarita calcarea GSE-NOS-MK-12-04C TaxID=2839659 RepID=A0A951QN33_9CYAN|nr:YfbM family protein [Cyanomargarita calcarea GSE-NOS-MK-12-04C]